MREAGGQECEAALLEDLLLVVAANLELSESNDIPEPDPFTEAEFDAWRGLIRVRESVMRESTGGSERPARSHSTTTASSSPSSGSRGGCG